MRNYLIAILLLSGCSSAKPFYDKKGQMFMQFRKRDASDAMETAMADAQEVCDHRKQRVSIIDKKNEYYGDIPEAEYLKWQRISRVATTVGSMHDDPIGDAGIRFGGGTQAALSNCGYEATVTFDCK